MDLVLDELVRSSQELRREKDDRGGAVSDLLVLLLSKRDQNASLKEMERLVSTVMQLPAGSRTHGRVGDLEEVQDGSAVVRDGNVLEYTRQIRSILTR